MRHCKKSIVIMIIIAIILMCLFFGCKIYYSSKKIITDEYIKIEGMWVGDDFCFTNRDIINSIIDCINTANKSWLVLHHQTNESPDSMLRFTDKNGTATNLYFYGNYMWYDGKQYRVDTSRIWYQDDLSLYECYQKCGDEHACK